MSLLSVWSAEPLPDQAFMPWIPKQLDDWPALVAEAKAYVTTTNELQKRINPVLYFSVRIDENRLGVRDGRPTPPVNGQADDVISMHYLFVTKKDGGSSIGCGGSEVWRAKGTGAAGATVTYCTKMTTSMGEFPDLTAKSVELDASVKASHPPTSPWASEAKTFENGTIAYWLASWQRVGDRGRTRDDVEGPGEPLRPEDLRWLAGPPALLAPRPIVQPATPALYADFTATHVEVQRALIRLRAGIPANPVMLYVVSKDGVGASAGLRAGDVALAINGKPVRSREDCRDQLKEIGTRGFTIHFARLGSLPKDIVVPAGKTGIEVANSVADPRTSVLAAVQRIDATLVQDVVVALYVYDNDAITRRAIENLGSRLPVAYMTFIRAWQAAAKEDFGLVDQLLSAKKVGSGIAKPDVELNGAMDAMRVANRQRSGRFVWAWPDTATIPGDQVLRRMVNAVPVAERFNLFSGMVPSTIFSTSILDRVELQRGAKDVMKIGGGTLASTDKWRSVGGLIRPIPKRCEWSCRFTIAPSPQKTGTEVATFVAPLPHLSVSFSTLSKTAITNAGVGGVKIHLGGMVTCRTPTLDPQEFSKNWEYEPVPIACIDDGANWNTLRIVRIANFQRTELNGHLVMQGFLPLLDESAEKEEAQIGLSLSAEDVVCVFQDVRIAVPAEVREANF